MRQGLRAGLALLLTGGIASASTPASHDVTVPTRDGETTTISWTGTAMPGANQTSECTQAIDPSVDHHGINISVPMGAYASATVTAKLRIEWDDDLQDLILTALRDGVAQGSADGGEPSEALEFTNPQPGAWDAAVCSFQTLVPTDYRATLTLTAAAGADADGDGVRNTLDQCADTVAGTNVDSKGCPTGLSAYSQVPSQFGKPRVVVADIDSGINPYHEAYYAHGSQVTRELLEELGVPARNVVKLTRKAGNTFAQDLAADKPFWDNVKRGELYHFVGTNIVAVSFAPPGTAYLKPDTSKSSHGVGTSSSVVDANPDAILLFVEAHTNLGSAETHDFAFLHPAVDIVTTSYGVSFVLPEIGNTGVPKPEYTTFNTTYKGVVGNGKLHFSSGGNGPAATFLRAGAGPWWSIGVTGFNEGESEGKEIVSGYVADFVSDFYQDIPYCMNCKTGREAGVGGTSFSTPRAAGVASRVLLEARRALNYGGGITGNARKLMVKAPGKSISNWDLRRALEQAAHVAATADYAPFDTSIPNTPVAPWLMVGWGNLTADPAKGVVAAALSELGLGSTPRAKDPGFCEYQTKIIQLRQHYWNTLAPVAAGITQETPASDPFVYCKSALPAPLHPVTQAPANEPSSGDDIPADGTTTTYSQEGTSGATVQTPPSPLASDPAPQLQGLGYSVGGALEHTYTYTLPSKYTDYSKLVVRLDWDQAFKDFFSLEVTAPDGTLVQSVFVNTNYQEAAFVTPKPGVYTIKVKERRTTTGKFRLKVNVTRQSPLTPTPNALDAAKDDVVVIAVIDSGINPYHWDYLAAKMPQALNSDPNDDLPLDQDPSTWISGYPSPSSFKSYTRLPLTLNATNPDQDAGALHTADAAQWAKIRYSEGTNNGDVNMYWFPGTKIIGHVAFSPGSVAAPHGARILGASTGPVDTWSAGSHGIGTSSVSAGNIHGSCPECVIVYVHGTSEQANEWVAKQKWIDLQTNSYGFSSIGISDPVVGLSTRDRTYAGSDTEQQRRAIERGQQIFFSAGNGIENAFAVPNPTLFSSQEGPDWIVTVGAVAPSGTSYSGAGKPADIASVGGSYPSAPNTGTASTVGGSSTFGGTSNATPVIAGLYAEALYRLRRLLPGPSRLQSDGKIAIGEPMACGTARADCAIADGRVTVHELREALFRGARYTPQGWNAAGNSSIPESQNQKELEFMAEGHGTYFGKMLGETNYEIEVRRIVDFVTGKQYSPQDEAQRQWFIADSMCRQAGWGEWDYGYAKADSSVAPDPVWPIRTWLANACPLVLPVAVTVEKGYANLTADEAVPPPDRDGDGVPDDSDNCEATANPSQADADDDGKGDACDTAARDTTPDAFGFAEQRNVPPNQFVTSETVALSGFNADAPITVSGGQYSVNGGSFTSDAGQVPPGATLALRHIAADTPETPRVTTVTVGGVSASFRSVSAQAPAGDTTPDPFAFAERSGMATNVFVISEGITITGIDTATPVSIVNGQYSLDGGAYTSDPGTLVSGQVLRVRHVTASTSSTTTESTVSVGTFSTTFRSTTSDVDRTPNAFNFTTQDSVEAGAIVESNVATPDGFDTAVSIVPASGQAWRIGGAGDWSTGNGTLLPGQSIQVRHTAASTSGGYTKTTLRLGGVACSFTTRTR